ncbi:hypothetical protein ACHAWU_010349 [Discostella pseudostelligera]|uniref:TraB family protein n=1 Tax=Discostella pseudostelligera TaxID=259834 RepID=A0ABD3MUW1_9STRA
MFSREDSCDVYGELNLYDNNTLNEIVQCQNSTLEFEATLADIPDEGLREEVKAKILETILQYVEIDSDTAETLASSFDSEPLSKLYRFITFANTPEYMEKYAYNLISGEGSSFLDLDILALGRPAGALEEVSTQCTLIQAMALSAEMLDQAFALDPDGTSFILRAKLNASFSPLLQPYKCGDIDEISDALSMEEPSELDGLLLTSRNQQMAAKVDEILTAAESDKKMLFAVGLAHWLVGSDNMISLLEGYGYSMEHIPIWNATQIDDPSNQDCGVVYNSETGLFVEDGSIGNETSDTVPTTASTSPTKMPSQGAEKEAVTEPVASASCPMIGIATITMMIVWSSYMLGVYF